MIHIKASNINGENFKALKEFMRKKGFTAWEFEGDYEILKISFKDNASALKAFHDSEASMTEVGAFGDVTVERGVITVELNDDARNAVSSKTTAEAEGYHYTDSGNSLSFDKEFDESKVKGLISRFDVYASHIDDFSKYKRVQSNNDDIIDDLRQMGCTTWTIKDVQGNGGKHDWTLINTTSGRL